MPQFRPLFQRLWAIQGLRDMAGSASLLCPSLRDGHSEITGNETVSAHQQLTKKEKQQEHEQQQNHL